MLPDYENVSLGKHFIAPKQFSFGSQEKRHHLRDDFTIGKARFS